MPRAKTAQQPTLLDVEEFENANQTENSSNMQSEPRAPEPADEEFLRALEQQIDREAGVEPEKPAKSAQKSDEVTRIYGVRDGHTETYQETRARLTRPIMLIRAGNAVQLNFKYDARLVEKARSLPLSRFDKDSSSWFVELSREAVDELRTWYTSEGLTDVYIDELLEEGEYENFEELKGAVLREGSLRRPFLVQMTYRDDVLFSKLRAVPGGQWEKKAQAMSYPATSAPALIQLVDKNIITDPSNLLKPADLTVFFNARNGGFIVAGDPRAQEAFDKHYPKRDIVEEWKRKEFDVAFGDPFSAEVYRSELARHNSKVLHPAGLREPLFEFQARNVAVAVEREGFGVWDQPGLGKSATAIGWAWELMENRKAAERTVIVVPGAVKTQFGREITRFTGETNVVVIDGTKAKRKKLYEQAHHARWVVLNYDLLRLDYEFIAPLVKGALLVADEAHRLKSRQSKRSQAMRQLAQKASRRLALSGTPVENNPGEWYTLMNSFVVPGVFGTPMEFFNRYSYPGRFGGFEGARNLQELKLRSQPHYIRSTKKDVAKHLPPLIVQNMVLDADDKLAAALNRAHKLAQEEIAEEALERRNLQKKNAFDNGDLLEGELAGEIESGAAMTAVGMLRLLCSSPRLLHVSQAPAAKALTDANLIPEEDGPKLDALRERALETQNNGERLVVFTGFKTMAKLIAERFDQDGVNYVLYTGETTTTQRDEAVKQFTKPPSKNNPGPTVFLATDAAAEGLNLGAQCSTLVNFDLAFKPSTMIQRANRIHRLDGDPSRRYLVLNFTLAKTIEEGIIRMVGAKADLSDAILGEHGSRRNTTGRSGRNVFEHALQEWNESNS